MDEEVDSESLVTLSTLTDSEVKGTTWREGRTQEEVRAYEKWKRESEAIERTHYRVVQEGQRSW